MKDFNMVWRNFELERWWVRWKGWMNVEDMENKECIEIWIEYDGEGGEIIMFKMILKF